MWWTQRSHTILWLLYCHQNHSLYNAKTFYYVSCTPYCWKQGPRCLIIRQMIKTWSQNVHNILGQKGPINPGCTHSIPHTNLKHHVMVFGELTCNFLLFWESAYPLEWNQALLPKRMRVASVCPSYTIWRYQLTPFLPQYVATVYSMNTVVLYGCKCKFLLQFMLIMQIWPFTVQNEPMIFLHIPPT